MSNIDDLNKIFSFKDAVKTVENILNETRKERDSYGPPEDSGLYVNWDSYYVVQGHVEVLEDVLEALSNESGIMHNVRAHDEREVTL